MQNISIDLSINNIVDFLENNNIKFCPSIQNANIKIETFCPLNALKNNAITWIRNVKDLPKEELKSFNNIILIAELGQTIDININVIYAENAHRTFFRILEYFFSSWDIEKKIPQIEKSATVLSRQIGKDVYIGHNTFIDENVVLGDYVKIYNNVTIQGNCQIGDYTTIESGTTIGGCGYGHYRDEMGNPVCVAHFGGVIIGKHVKIGANNAISRGCLSDTIIEDYVKTDNLCHIAHNDHIKQRSMLTACTEISGSVTVEEDVWFGPGSVINNGITIGKNAYLGLGTVVTKDVPEKKVVVGVPARILRDRK